MKCIEVDLSTKRVKPIPSLDWQIGERTCRNEKGVREIVVELVRNGTTRTLREVGDTSRGPGAHRVWLIIEGEGPTPFAAVFGGVMAYWLDRDGNVVGSERLFREVTDEEYWDLRIILPQAGGAVVVYEGGAMFLEPDLTLLWHIRKRYNDIIDSIDGQRVYFVSETGERWSAST